MPRLEDLDLSVRDALRLRGLQFRYVDGLEVDIELIRHLLGAFATMYVFTVFIEIFLRIGVPGCISRPVAGRPGYGYSALRGKDLVLMLRAVRDMLWRNSLDVVRFGRRRLEEPV